MIRFQLLVHDVNTQKICKAASLTNKATPFPASAAFSIFAMANFQVADN
jgi:hypothetical protein